MSNWVKKGIVSFSMALRGVEKSALNRLEDSNTGMVKPIGQNRLMRDLKEGNVTQEVKQFRKQHYMILQESEKYKAKWGKDGDYQMLTESEINNRKIATGDPYDSYTVEVSVENQPLTESMLNPDELVYPIKVNRVVNTNVKLEEVSDKLHVRDIDGTNKLLDFYIPIKRDNQTALREAQNLMTNPGINNFNNITNVSFTTPGGNMMVFEYRVLAFDKVVEYNGHYIVKMFAECVNNGTWAAQKYMIID
jgi:hypothetical protein